jgi:hypothetical protein
MSVETSIISRIAIHATAESALPTLPSAGTNITQAAWSTAGFDTLGSRNFRSDDYDFGEESFSLGAVEERIHKTQAPLSFGTDDLILLGRKNEDFELTVYDMDVSLLAFASDLTITSNVMSHANTFTARSLAFEVHKQGIFYFPKSMIRLSNIDAGMVEDQVATATFVVTPLSTSTYAMGWYYEQY